MFKVIRFLNQRLESRREHLFRISLQIRRCCLKSDTTKFVYSIGEYLDNTLADNDEDAQRFYTGFYKRTRSMVEFLEAHIVMALERYRICAAFWGKERLRDQYLIHKAPQVVKVLSDLSKLLLSELGDAERLLNRLMWATLESRGAGSAQYCRERKDQTRVTITESYEANLSMIGRGDWLDGSCAPAWRTMASEWNVNNFTHEAFG